MAENQDFDIREGDAVIIDDTVTQSDGSAENITGYDGLVTVAKYDGGPTVIQFDETDSRFRITDGSNGELEAKLEPADTDGLSGEGANREYYYEIELTDNDGNPLTVTTGTITVKPSH